MTNANDEPDVEDAGTPDRLKQTNPFDSPFVASVLFFALALWFGYDGWINPNTKSVMFNRIMFGVFAALFAWGIRQDIIDLRRRRDATSKQRQ